MQILLAFLSRAVLAGLVWVILTEGATSWDAWVIGSVAIGASAALSTALIAPTRWSWLAAARFGGYFIRESWRGGLDVAWRAFHPRMPLEPGIIRHDSYITTEIARVALANTSSLMPGSLVVDLDDRGLTIHALDVSGESAVRTVASTERHIAGMFRVTRPAPVDNSGPGE